MPGHYIRESARHHFCDLPNAYLDELGALWCCDECGRHWRCYYSDTCHGPTWRRCLWPPWLSLKRYQR
jgi:hypothetical protein